MIALLSVLLVALMPLEANAGIFDPPVSDKSIEYLGLIFGGNIGGIQLGQAINASPFLGQLFQIINGIVLAISIVILSYTSGLAVINTAQEGEVMGKKWSSVWIPLRSSLGLLLLAPIPGSGYSLIQVTVIWIIINGIGAADKVWNFVLDNLSASIVAGQSINLSNESDLVRINQNAQSIAKGLFGSLLCVKILENIDVIDPNLSTIKTQPIGYFFIDSPSGTPQKTPQIVPRVQHGIPSIEGTLEFGIGNSLPELKTICGSISIKASLPDSFPPQANVSLAQRLNIVRDAYETKKQALGAMMNYIAPVAEGVFNNIASSNNTNLTGLLYNALAIYKNTMMRLEQKSMIIAAGGTFNVTDKISDFATIDQGKNDGWILAGSYYYKLSSGVTGNNSGDTLLQTATKDPPLAADIPKIFDPNSSKDSLNIPNLNYINIDINRFKPYHSFLNNNLDSLFTAPVDIGTSNKDLDIMTPRKFYALLGPLVGASIIFPALGAFSAAFIALNELVNRGFNKLLDDNAFTKVDPLKFITSLGAEFMKNSEIALIGVFVGGTLASMVAASCSALNPLGLMASTQMMLLMPMAIFMCGIVWLYGASMAIYMPMVPFMFFSVTALGWIMLVIESIVAAPVVALGIITPASDELGSLKTALGMLANIFLRPMLMIIGLIFSIKLFKVFFIFINKGFKVSIGTILGETGKSLFAWIPIIGLYLGFVITLINKIFSLIYRLPDKVLSWIGIQVEATSGVEEAVGGAKKQMGEQAQATSSALRKHAMTPVDTFTDSMSEAKQQGSPGGVGAAGGGGKKAPGGSPGGLPGSGGDDKPAGSPPGGLPGKPPGGGGAGALGGEGSTPPDGSGLLGSGGGGGNQPQTSGAGKAGGKMAGTSAGKAAGGALGGPAGSMVGGEVGGKAGEKLGDQAEQQTKKDQK